MKNTIFIATLIITLLLMFATSLLLDLEIVKRQFVRELIIYIAIAAEGFLGFIMLKYQIKK